MLIQQGDEHWLPWQQKRPLLHLACERGAWNCVKHLAAERWGWQHLRADVQCLVANQIIFRSFRKRFRSYEELSPRLFPCEEFFLIRRIVTLIKLGVTILHMIQHFFYNFFPQNSLNRQQQFSPTPHPPPLPLGLTRLTNATTSTTLFTKLPYTTSSS